MSGDNLTICLFLVGTGIAIGLTAMSTAGWRHPVLIGGLFLLAGACFISGFAWPWIKDASPVVTQSVTQVATNPVSWFLVLILGVASAHLPSKRASVISESDQSFGAQAFRRAPDSPLPAPASAAQTALEIGPPPTTEKERHFVTSTPADLIGLYEGKLRHQGDKLAEPFRGKWMNVSGTIKEISSSEIGIFMVLEIPGYNQLFLLFNPDWEDRLYVLQKGQIVSALGRIKEISAANIQLNDCELT